MSDTSIDHVTVATGLAYDRPSSFLAVLGRDALKPFGALLDGKVDAVIAAVTKAN
jgi:hypothetical protein